MPYDNLTGHVVADIEYRIRQTDDAAQLEEHGIINYDLSLGSGTGNSQANEVWYANRNFTTNDTLDMSSLSLRRFGKTYTTSFLGVSGTGDVKGVKIDNLSSEAIYLNLPFANFSGSIRVPGSGSYSMSNHRGWTINAVNKNVTVSGTSTTGNKSYNIGFIGVGLPSILQIENILNIENLASGDYLGSGLLYLDYIGSSIVTGEIPYEYAISNDSIDAILQVENLLELAIATGTGLGSSMMMDWYSPTGFSDFLNVEWTGNAASSLATGTGCSGCGAELLSNPQFDFGLVSDDMIIDTAYDISTTCSPHIGYPNWIVSGAFVTTHDNPIYRNFSLCTTSLYLCQFPPTHGYPPETVNSYKAYYEPRSSIQQSVAVTSGRQYKFEWFPLSGGVGLNGIPINGYPCVGLYAGDGSPLASSIITPEFLASSGFRWVSLTGTAIDSQITVKFEAPGGGNSSLGQIGSFLTWGGDQSRGRRVSLYRIA